MKKAILILIVLGLTSCQKTMLVLYGVHNPRITKTKKIESKFEKYGMNGDYSFSISDSGAIKYFTFQDSFNKLFIYTRSGKQIIPNDTNSCSSESTRFTDYFRDSSLVSQIATSDTNYFNQYFVSLNNTEVEIANDKPYLAVIFWATMAGRLNKNSSATWANSLLAAEDVTVVCVNLDPREFWEIDIK